MLLPELLNSLMDPFCIRAFPPRQLFQAAGSLLEGEVKLVDGKVCPIRQLRKDCLVSALKAIIALLPAGKLQAENGFWVYRMRFRPQKVGTKPATELGFPPRYQSDIHGNAETPYILTAQAEIVPVEMENILEGIGVDAGDHMISRGRQPQKPPCHPAPHARAR